MVRLRVTGIKELIAANNKMIDRLKSNKDYEEMLDKIVEKARNNCPVKTGDMESAIYWKPLGNGWYSIVCAVPYARYIEYGTRYFPVPTDVASPRGYKSSSGKMASVPFLRSAIWDIQRQFPDRIFTVIKIIYN